MSEIIKAWVYDPTKSLIGRKSEKATCVTITCENPSGCDLYTKEKTCALLGISATCKSGKKTVSKGPTQRARSFYSWINEQKTWCAAVSHDLAPFQAHHRIFHANGWYHLPYPAMSDAFLLEGAPIRHGWVRAEDLDAGLLDRICSARPRSMLGHSVDRYQKEVVPKFIMDLRAHYPQLFELLSDVQKSRIESFSHIGRKALLVTVADGPVALGRDIWQWDGEALHREVTTALPLKGTLTSRLVPSGDAVVTITRDDQVTPDTRFVD